MKKKIIPFIAIFPVTAILLVCIYFLIPIPDPNRVVFNSQKLEEISLTAPETGWSVKEDEFSYFEYGDEEPYSFDLEISKGDEYINFEAIKVAEENELPKTKEELLSKSNGQSEVIDFSYSISDDGKTEHLYYVTKRDTRTVILYEIAFDNKIFDVKTITHSTDTERIEQLKENAEYNLNQNIDYFK